VVVCLVRNGELYLRSFLDHYSRLGVRQIAFLDNGSSDNTVELIRGCGLDNVTLLRCALPYRRYQFLFKEYLLSLFGVGGWRLHVDVDELFDYPRSEELPLQQLLDYLNQGGYSAMVAYLLDMFAPGPLCTWRSSPDDDLRTTYPLYDISNIKRRPYTQQYGNANQISNPAIELYWGGIRNSVFSSKDWLTKHPLVRLESGVQLRGNVSHDIYGARLADVSGVLYHYKFHDRLQEQARQAVREKNYFRGSLQYRRYLAVLDAEPNLTISGPTARRLESVDDLLAQGFLAESAAYREFAAAVAQPSRYETRHPCN
jgi:hypothetical protein